MIPNAVLFLEKEKEKETKELEIITATGIFPNPLPSSLYGTGSRQENDLNR